MELTSIALSPHMRAAFDALGGSSPLVSTVASLLVKLAQRAGVDAAIEVGQTFLLVVVAAHSNVRLPRSSWPLPNATLPPAPSTIDWCYLATRQLLHVPFSPALRDAFDDTFALLATEAREMVGAGNVCPPATLDYGIGRLLKALDVVSEEHDSNAFHPLGKLMRLGIEMEQRTASDRDFIRPAIVEQFATDVGLGSRFSVALALLCRPHSETFPIVSVTSHPLVYERIRCVTADWVELAAITARDTHRDTIGEAMGTLRDVVMQKVGGTRLFGFARAPQPADELARTIALAVDALSADSELRESWDVQRWGGFFSQTTTAHFFPLGLCALSLDAAGVNIADRARALLMQGTPDGFRYFEKFSSIPPDCDDLGIAFALAARIPHLPEDDVRKALAAPLDVFIRNTSADGAIPVWFDKYLQEPLAGDAPTWRGSRCLAAAVNVILGAIEFGADLPPGFLDRCVRWIVRTWQTEGESASYFYGASYTRLLLVRLAEIAVVRLKDSDVCRDVQAMRDGICAQILAQRRTDGSFGSLLDTACFLAALACAPHVDADPWPAVTFLCAHQDPDGFWPRQPLYLTLGKDNAPAAHGSRAITAALCLYALARWQKRLASTAT